MRHDTVLALAALVLVGCNSGGSGDDANPGGWVGGGTTVPTSSDGGEDGGPSPGTSDAGTASHDAGTEAAPRPDSGPPGEPDGSAPNEPAGFVFSPYKDTSINMNWNTNVISTDVPGSASNARKRPHGQRREGDNPRVRHGRVRQRELGRRRRRRDGRRERLAADAGRASSTSSRRAAPPGASRAARTRAWPRSSDAGHRRVCIGVDFDIEAGQSQSVIQDLIARIQAAHGAYPALRFSLTLATLANNNGASTAQSLGSSAQDSFNTYGDEVLAAVKSTLGFDGSAASWPSYVTVDLMTMDYGSPSAGVCVVAGGSCDMGQSALQAAYNLHDDWGVPYAAHRAHADDRAERREQRAVHARRRRHGREVRRRAGPRGRPLLVVRPRHRLRGRALRRPRATRWAPDTPVRTAFSRGSSPTGCDSSNRPRGGLHVCGATPRLMYGCLFRGYSRCALPGSAVARTLVPAARWMDAAGLSVVRMTECVNSTSASSSKQPNGGPGRFRGKKQGGEDHRQSGPVECLRAGRRTSVRRGPNPVLARKDGQDDPRRRSPQASSTVKRAGRFVKSRGHSLLILFSRLAAPQRHRVRP